MCGTAQLSEKAVFGMKERPARATWDQAVVMSNDYDDLGELLMRYIALGGSRDLVKNSAPDGLTPSIEADGRHAMRLLLEIAGARLADERTPAFDLSEAPFEPRATFKAQVLIARKSALEHMQNQGPELSPQLRACIARDLERTRQSLLIEIENPLLAKLAIGDTDGARQLLATPDEGTR